MKNTSNVLTILSICLFICVCTYIIHDTYVNRHGKRYPELYSIQQLKEVRPGDTIYARICGDVMRVKVVINDTSIRVITMKRANIYQGRRDCYWMEDTKTYDEISGN